MKQSLKPVSTIALLITGVVLLFQNCSDPLGTNSNEASFSENLPFAYDTTIDTIAYMSCAGGDSAADRQAIWTFSVGAFGSSSGIRLRKNYLDMTYNFSSGQRAAALAESPQNANAVLQLAIRQAGGMQSILTSSGSSGDVGEDFGNILGPLDESQIATKLASVNLEDPKRINYFTGIPGLDGRRVEGSIRFTQDEGEANSVRGYMAGSALLTTTYSADHSPNKDARGPAGLVDSSAYGRGYKVQFNYPTGESVPRAIVAIRELDLETGRDVADGTGWACPLELQLKIARTCSECGCLSDTGKADLLEKIRRVLKVENWYVNLAEKCVVQKTSFQQCYPSLSVGNFHYVSVCTRL